MTEGARTARPAARSGPPPWTAFAVASILLLATCSEAAAPEPPVAGVDGSEASDPAVTTGPPGCPPREGRPLDGGDMTSEAQVLQEGDEDTPRVEAVFYPHPSYEAKLWSQWGQGLVLPDGRFLSAIGDHLGPDGNAFLYEYDPRDRRLSLLSDVRSFTEHEPGAWGYGKVHGQIVPGPCGETYFATYWGDRDDLAFGPSYQGDVLFRLDPEANTLENLGGPIPRHGIPSLTGWPEGGLLYGESPDPLVEGNHGPFFVYDVAEGEVVFTDDDRAHTGFRSIAVDADGRAYYSIGGGRLKMYDPRTGDATVHPHAMPGDWLRAASRPGPDGTVYGVTEDPRMLFALDPDGAIRTLGPVRDYVTSVALHPGGDRLFYVPGAHGSAWEYGAPLIEVDTETGQERVVVELRELGEDALGLRLGGTYNVAVDPGGEIVYIGMNAGTLDSDESFGEVVLVIVHLP